MWRSDLSAIVSYKSFIVIIFKSKMYDNYKTLSSYGVTLAGTKIYMKKLSIKKNIHKKIYINKLTWYK